MRADSMFIPEKTALKDQGNAPGYPKLLAGTYWQASYMFPMQPVRPFRDRLSMPSKYLQLCSLEQAVLSN